MRNKYLFWAVVALTCALQVHAENLTPEASYEYEVYPDSAQDGNDWENKSENTALPTGTSHRAPIKENGAESANSNSAEEEGFEYETYPAEAQETNDVRSRDVNLEKSSDKPNGQSTEVSAAKLVPTKTTAKVISHKAEHEDSKDDNEGRKSYLSSYFDGKNFVSLKGGVAKPVHAKISELKVFDIQKPTYTVGFTIGRQFNDLLSFDLEYRFNPNSKSISTEFPAKSWEVSSNQFLVNAKLNMMKHFMITPYIKAGAGFGINKAGDAIGTNAGKTCTYWPGETTSGFAWQAGMGFNFKYNDLISTELEYMYANLGQFSTQDTQVTRFGNNISSYHVPAVSGKLTEHIVTLGIKLNF